MNAQLIAFALRVFSALVAQMTDEQREQAAKNLRDSAGPYREGGPSDEQLFMRSVADLITMSVSNR